MQRLKSLSLYIFLGLLAYMPLHIFLSTWLGTSFDVLEVAKVLKDIIMVIGFGLTVVASLRKPWFKPLFKDPLVWLVIAYAALTIGLAAVRPTDTDAEALGIIYNLRFLVFAAYGVLLARLFDARILQRQAVGVVLATAAIVLAFGIVQYTLLPNNALAHVGYSRANGVLPAFFIDDKPDLERIMSTLRDPNSLGSYILIIGFVTLALLAGRKIPRQLGIGLLILAGTGLAFTFSRSAWLGFAVGGISWLGLRYGRQLGRLKPHKVLYVTAVVVIGGLLSVYALRNTYLVQNIVFHADQSTVLEDPNQLRGRFWRESLQDIKNEPLGGGPGTAGLVSIHNDVQGVKLNENYYLQIASEVGVAGLVLLISILGIVAKRLQKLSADPLAMGLLVAFIGLAITNVLVHIWSNEAVAYIWWGLAGLVLSVGQSAGAARKDQRPRSPS